MNKDHRNKSTHLKHQIFNAVTQRTEIIRINGGRGGGVYAGLTFTEEAGQMSAVAMVSWRPRTESNLTQIQAA